jgi:2,3-bisphosphoglycerate-independent phosphoglycerate mutase
MARPKPVILTILDGWGFNPSLEGNAVAQAKTPNYDRLYAANARTFINTSGPWVGLPDGQMGNSEVGHLNIGAGRVIRMDVTRIDVAILDGAFFENPALKGAMAHGKGSRLHLLGLVSDGGVHSHNTHLYALLEMARREGVADVCVHAFMDGRDTPPNSGEGFLTELQGRLQGARIATVIGRYYAMDRDKRWERVGRAYEAMVTGEGNQAADPVDYVRSQYAAGVTDEFIEPGVMAGDGRIRPGDAVIFFNFRADRAREITLALTDASLEGIARDRMPANLHYVTMTRYDKNYSFPVAFGPESHVNILADVMEQHGIKNLRCAETEKYPHVTYFFNGGNEKSFAGEDRQMVPSPKVATYDLMPEMSAAGVTDVIVKAVENDAYDVIIVNFANPDMVGHSGKLEAAVKACEAVDEGLGKIAAALEGKPYAWIITADHGNAELMVDPVTGGPHTYHTTNPVPLVLVGGGDGPLRNDGSLRDLSPTILGLLGIEKPAEMTGRDLREV